MYSLLFSQISACKGTSLPGCTLHSLLGSEEHSKDGSGAQNGDPPVDCAEILHREGLGINIMPEAADPADALCDTDMQQQNIQRILSQETVNGF